VTPGNRSRALEVASGKRIDRQEFNHTDGLLIGAVV
jgi:hypothetical protein